MAKLNYRIFKTKWGYFGVLWDDFGLISTILPQKRIIDTENALLRNFEGKNSEISRENSGFSELFDAIISYFDGELIDFSQFKKHYRLENYPDFKRKVLVKCLSVKYGKVLTYKDLADKAGNEKASRAVGVIMANNKLPLLIPCHRIIRSDGGVGGYSGAGGVKNKIKMLKMEGVGL